MPVVSCSFEHHAGDNTIWLGSNPILRRTSGGGQRPPIYLPLQPTSREDLQLDGHSRVSQCHKGTIHLQASMLSPGFEPRP
ncbi:hypothetical protein TNCV_5114251 [Trichonephila clavipes]|nr:hypothetical protein TNCV_5114251 [Trichonephila clavipes]